MVLDDVVVEVLRLHLAPRMRQRLVQVPLDLDRLDDQAAEVEAILGDHMKPLEQAAEAASGSTPGMEGEVPADWPQKEELDADTKARIEALFKEVEEDRSKALELKAELDRHGIFDKYEDRFLDLFRQAE